MQLLSLTQIGSRRVMQKDREEWRPINEYYEVSNLGRVRSKDRTWYNALTGTTVSRKGKILKPQNSHGYDRVEITENGKRAKKLVHRLVALAFLPNPENKPTVDHIDRNTHNNNVDNLRWADLPEQWENNQRAVSVRAIKGEEVITAPTMAELARLIGDYRTNIWQACNHPTRKVRGYRIERT